MLEFSFLQRLYSREYIKTRKQTKEGTKYEHKNQNKVSLFLVLMLCFSLPQTVFAANGEIKKGYHKNN